MKKILPFSEWNTELKSETPSSCSNKINVIKMCTANGTVRRWIPTIFSSAVSNNCNPLISTPYVSRKPIKIT